MSYPTYQLMDLIMDFKWDLAASHAKSNPLDAQFQIDLETPLYVACLFQPPANVIQELVLAYPDAITLPQTKNRDTPLHIACRYDVSYEVTNILLKHSNPTCLFIKSKWGKTPFDAFAEAFRVCLIDNMSQEGGTNNNITDSDKKVDMVRKLELLLRFASARNIPDDYSLSSWTMLHAVFSVKNVPQCIIEFILKEYSHCAKMKDDQGRLPFHVAVSSTWRPSYNVNYILKQLIRLYPQAVRVTYQGSFPLHLLLEAGKTRWHDDGVSIIHASAPYLVSVLNNKFYPFMIAACNNNNDNNITEPDINTIYSLLSAQPDILVGYIRSNNEDRTCNSNYCRPPGERTGMSNDFPLDGSAWEQKCLNFVTVVSIFSLSLIIFTMK